ncbi:MAG: hypothetical protein EXS50_01465, partial [Candidatus Taylorbacteria bacterium]|nr:hypothetical protein [Candidatus Taylorbacteria bacterium]
MNNEVYHDGKKYISTKSAALRFGYAHDYVGQLCRSGKVDAKMVGRSWYVSEIAIRNYKSIQLPVSFNLPQNRPLSTKDFPVKYLLDSKPLTPVLATRDWEVEPQKVPSVTVQKIDSVSKRDTPIISPFLKEFAEKTLALAISTSLVISLFTANDINYGGKIHDQLVRGTTTMVKDLQEGAH